MLNEADRVMRRIEKAKPEDFEAIYEIYTWFVHHSSAILDLAPESRERFYQKLESILKEHPFYCAFDDDHLIGYGYVHTAFEKEGYRGVQEVTIYFRQGNHFGLAKKLMERLIADCKNRKDRILVSCITADNQRSIDFHRHFGFEQTGFLKKAAIKHGNSYDVLWMSLDLQ